MKRICLGLLVVVLVAACSSGEDTGSGDTSSTTQPEDSTTTSTSDGPGRVTTTTSGQGQVAVPEDVVESAIEQASEDTGVGTESLEPVSAQQVVWSDASLGCPQEGQSYIQVLTDGYWVILDGPEGELDYRSTMELDFRRCRNGQPPQSTLTDR